MFWMVVVDGPNRIGQDAMSIISEEAPKKRRSYSRKLPGALKPGCEQAHAVRIDERPFIVGIGA